MARGGAKNQKTTAPKKPAKDKPAATSKARGKSTSRRKAPTPTPDPKSSDSEPEEEQAQGEGTSKDGIPKIDSQHWKGDRSFKLIQVVSDNTNIRRGLYPEKGQNVATSKGGGQPKTHWHWEVAKGVFTNDADFSEAFALALLPGPSATKSNPLQQKWGKKIKNRLDVMAGKVGKFITEMGQTGAGLESAEAINQNQNPQLWNKWLEIEKTCPWFWEMGDLVGQRPNRVWVGLGNSGTQIGPSVLDSCKNDDSLGAEDEINPRNEADTSSDAANILSPPFIPSTTPPVTEDDPSLTLLDADHDVAPNTDVIDVKPMTSTKPTGATVKRKNNAAAKSSNKRPKAPNTYEEKFVEAAVAEEATEQKRLDVEKAKINAAMTIKVEAECNKTAQAKARMKLKLDYRLKRKQMKQDAKDKAARKKEENTQKGGMTAMNMGMESNAELTVEDYRFPAHHSGSLLQNLLIDNESDCERSDSEGEVDSDDEDDDDEEEARHSAWVSSLEPDVSVISAGNADIDLDAKAIRDIVETGNAPQFASATSREDSSTFEKAETDPSKDL
ncbi:hypothetical protein BKA70DRAFT_1467350 [Coprinopsis sp. MPI-PUGE-AT-0042]|nr:hypothetical protein BKA70DRAFT_1467350 [Coprinopsis sp. MPI-PUGE-AT-0042]